MWGRVESPPLNYHWTATGSVRTERPKRIACARCSILFHDGENLEWTTTETSHLLSLNNLENQRCYLQDQLPGGMESEIKVWPQHASKPVCKFTTWKVLENGYASAPTVGAAAIKLASCWETRDSNSYTMKLQLVSGKGCRKLFWVNVCHGAFRIHKADMRISMLQLTRRMNNLGFSLAKSSPKVSSVNVS